MKLKFLTTTQSGKDVYVDLYIEETEIKGFFVPIKFDKYDTICLYFCSDLITVQQSPELLKFLNKYIKKTT